MMKNFCDACKKEISNRFSRPRVRVDVMNTQGAPYISHEYCDPCYMTFTAFLEDFTGEKLLGGQIH